MKQPRFAEKLSASDYGLEIGALEKFVSAFGKRKNASDNKRRQSKNRFYAFSF